MTPSHHLRRSDYPSRGGKIHYVDNRTLLTLCGTNALDFHLVTEPHAVPDCPKCIEVLDQIAGRLL